MTQGAVIFALGHDLEYVQMAAWNAARIQHYLDLPVSVITDQDVPRARFDQIIRIEPSKLTGSRYFSDIGRVIPWHNLSRCLALELTPYDRTLLLDADYVINSSDLQTLVRHGPDILCFRSAYDATTGRELANLNHFGDYNMPTWWATVVIFSKTNHVNAVFSHWRMVRDNWQHYRDIYRIRDSLFRNDYALSIALALASGHTLKVDAIPWRMATVLPEVEIKLSQSKKTGFTIRYVDPQKRYKTQHLDDQDLHVMAKARLGDIVAKST